MDVPVLLIHVAVIQPLRTAQQPRLAANRSAANRSALFFWMGAKRSRGPTTFHFAGAADITPAMTTCRTAETTAEMPFSIKQKYKQIK